MQKRWHVLSQHQAEDLRALNLASYNNILTPFYHKNQPNTWLVEEVYSQDSHWSKLAQGKYLKKIPLQEIPNSGIGENDTHFNEKIIDPTEYVKIHPFSEKKLPNVLYHYTDAVGLENILSSNHMRATDVSYFNDKSEQTYAAHLLQETIRESLEGDLLEKYGGFLKDDFIPPDLHLYARYACCFSENGDLLSQWRSYGDKGGGFSLGFNPYAIGLTIPPLERGHKFLLGKIEYDRQLQKSLILPFIKAAKPILYKKNNNPHDTIDTWEAFYERIFKCEDGTPTPVFEKILFFKDTSFREELEWRIVTIELFNFNLFQDEIIQNNEKSPTKFRVKNGMLVPYQELDLTPNCSDYEGKLPITEIIIGPTSNKYLSKQSAERFAREKGYRLKSGFKESRIPLSF